MASLCVGCGSQAGPTPPRPSPTHPNVLVLMTDDQTNSDLHVMPNTRHLIGADGAAFARFYVSYPLCCPSRTTFLTGQYAHNTGVQGNSPDTDGGGYLNLLEPDRTLPVWLQSAGYETGVVGKWPEFPPPGVPPGWNRWMTLTQSTIAHYYDYSLNWPGGGTRQYGSQSRDYNTSVLTRLADGFITDEARGNSPFFLWVTYTAPHFGFGRHDAASRRCGSVPAPGVAAGQTAVPAPADAHAFAHTPLPRPPSFNERDVRDKPAFLRKERLGPADIRQMTTDYRCRLASLLGVDRSVARIVHTLRRTGQLDETLVMFTSDNGFLLGQHREAGKNLPYEASSRVPLLMRGPGIPAGRRITSPTVNTDLAPTILGAAHTAEKADRSRPMDGQSLLPLVDGHPDPDRAVLIEGRDDAAPFGSRGAYEAISYQGVRTSRYLYVEWHRALRSSSAEAAAAPIGSGHTAGLELYDTTVDPGERQNQAEAPGYRRVRRRLASVLARLKRCAAGRCLVNARIPAPQAG